MPLGPLQTNGYLVHNEKDAVFIDPGAEGEKVITAIEEAGVTLQAVILTHAHFDHIGGVERLVQHFDVPLYVHKEEAEWLKEPAKNGSSLFPGIEPISVTWTPKLLSGEGEWKVGPFSFQMFETPGHSPGSISFYMSDENIIFSGDILFQGGIGRTDLPGGSMDTLLSTIHSKLLTLPDETTVANGHGPTTTIGEEKEMNPFLNGF